MKEKEEKQLKAQAFSAIKSASKHRTYHVAQSYLNLFSGINPVLDLLEDPSCFRAATGSDQPKLLQMLLNYMYETNQIMRDPQDNNSEQAITYYKLQEILTQAKKTWSLAETPLRLLIELLVKSRKSYCLYMKMTKAPTPTPSLIQMNKLILGHLVKHQKI